MNSGFIEDPLSRQSYRFSRDGDVPAAHVADGEEVSRRPGMAAEAQRA